MGLRSGLLHPFGISLLTKDGFHLCNYGREYLSDAAKARIAKGGHTWTETVSKAKDFIVIHSINVLWNNILANGINPVTMAKDWAFITANVRSYQKLHSKPLQCTANTLAGKGNDATESQIT